MHFLQEEKFSLLLNRGIEILNENLNKVKNNSFPGEVAFKLYDTYGFPLDLTQDILKNKSLTIDLVQNIENNLVTTGKAVKSFLRAF